VSTPVKRAKQPLYLLIRRGTRFGYPNPLPGIHRQPRNDQVPVVGGPNQAPWGRSRRALLFSAWPVLMSAHQRRAELPQRGQSAGSDAAGWIGAPTRPVEDLGRRRVGARRVLTGREDDGGSRRAREPDDAVAEWSGRALQLRAAERYAARMCVLSQGEAGRQLGQLAGGHVRAECLHSRGQIARQRGDVVRVGRFGQGVRG
jgi:hypothetical protein